MARPRNGTLAQIAESCGVAISTVSYVLRGKHREARISDTRAAQILEAARLLDYRPNSAAVAMRSGRFNAIALAISEIPGRQSVFPDLLDGLLRGSRSRDWHLVVGMLSDEQFDARGPLPRILREWAVDGLLINYLYDFPKSLLAALDEVRLPSILVNIKRNGDCVYPDDEAAAGAATRHLLTKGHRRIAYLTGNASGHYSHHDRRAGYEQAMQEAGLASQIPLSGSFIPRAERAAAILPALTAPGRPTAIITYEADDALAVYTAAQKAGLRIPEDLSLIGIHDREIDFAGVAITTWLIPAGELARLSLDLLAQKIEEPDRVLDPAAVAFTHTDDHSVAAPPNL